ncbi:hypothetical protein O9993_23310 [Vibrio lentus]|nr:hypothetical protein [Vibrio lentus]
MAVLHGPHPGKSLIGNGDHLHSPFGCWMWFNTGLSLVPSIRMIVSEKHSLPPLLSVAITEIISVSDVRLPLGVQS